MRNITCSIADTRKRVFAEVAKMAYDAGGLVQRLYFLSGNIVENKYEAGKMGQETSECPSGAGNANGVCAVFRLAGQWTLAWSCMEICGLRHVLLCIDIIRPFWQTGDTLFL